jgi:hypothetical protein
MLIYRLYAWLLMMSLPAYFTSVTILRRHTTIPSMDAGHWIRATLCAAPKPVIQPLLVNITIIPTFSTWLHYPHANQHQQSPSVVPQVYTGTLPAPPARPTVFRSHQLAKPSDKECSQTSNSSNRLEEPEEHRQAFAPKERETRE